MPELTVGDIMDLLAKYPREQRVMVDGYESGYEDPVITEQSVIKKTKSPPYYKGPYTKYSRQVHGNAPHFPALIFGRNHDL